jgi:hypothetical protein
MAARIRLSLQPPVDPAFAARLPGFPSVWSPTRSHRYTLWRWWTPTPVTWGAMIGLNPSAADDDFDDRTVRRCTDFVRREGVDAMVMLNAFAFMATDPGAMRAHLDPLGPDNDLWIGRCCAGARFVVAAWGAHGAHDGRSLRLAELVPDPLCFGVTAAGEPRHPLYLASTAPLVPWRTATATPSGGRPCPAPDRSPASPR